MAATASYQSRYSPGKMVSAAQMLAEIMCARQAMKDGRELPLYFWKVPEWEKNFKRQIREANGILKLFSASAVFAALKTRDGRKIVSLGAPWLDDLCKSEQQKLDRHAAAAADEQAPNPTPEPPADLPSTRPPFVKKRSTASKLREMDEDF